MIAVGDPSYDGIEEALKQGDAGFAPGTSKTSECPWVKEERGVGVERDVDEFEGRLVARDLEMLRDPLDWSFRCHAPTSQAVARFRRRGYAAFG